ncbi:MAG: ChaB family protein [Pseudomonadota bacterium]|nr:MAG: ChaB family protein [Pseudomonadota bacterium]
MPYRTLASLPAAIRNHLPAHAQRIYRSAFNNAWHEYADRRNRETLAHKVAWAAVKKRYVKYRGEWISRARRP